MQGRTEKFTLRKGIPKLFYRVKANTDPKTIFGQNSKFIELYSSKFIKNIGILPNTSLLGVLSQIAFLSLCTYFSKHFVLLRTRALLEFGELTCVRASRIQNRTYKLDSSSFSLAIVSFRGCRM